MEFFRSALAVMVVVLAMAVIFIIASSFYEELILPKLKAWWNKSKFEVGDVCIYKYEEFPDNLSYITLSEKGSKSFKFRFTHSRSGVHYSIEKATLKKLYKKVGE